MENSQKNYLLPISIIVAAALIAGALVYNAGSKKTLPPAPGDNQIVSANVLETLADETQNTLF